MKEFLTDLKECFKYSLKMFLISFLVGIIVGGIICMVRKSFNWIFVIEWGARIVTYASCLVLFISAAFFAKKETMRPLSYENQWKSYFCKFNLAHVLFFTSLFCLIYSVGIVTILFYA